MEALIKILEKFDKKRNELVSQGKWNEDAVAECFEPCARGILCNGYFLVNGEYIIDLGAIELYYHEEEEGGIKDYIMYHTNAHSSKSKVYKLNNNSFPYFKFGSFNLHQSGIDVTFENEEKRYRASFLIRSYRLLRIEEERKLNDLTIPFDKCSTHIFDDMFYSGYGNTEIVWIPTDKKNRKSDDPIERIERTNVAVYEKPDIKDNKIYGSNDIIITKDDYNMDNKKYIKIKDKFYKRDMRKWQFKLKGIEEEK